MSRLHSGAVRAALLTIALGGVSSAFADQVASYKIGGKVVVSVSADGTGPFRYQWKRNGVDLSGATSATYTVANAQLSDAGSYSVSVTNAVGSAISDIATIAPEGMAMTPVTVPVITSQPISQTVAAGGSTVLSIGVSGSPAPSIQWRRNGIDIPGANSSVLAIPAIDANAAGIYSVVLTNSMGSVTSQAATLTVQSAMTSPTTRLSNVSIRTTPGSGAETLIVGFVTAGASKSILVRGVGPGLAQYVSSATYADPKLELYKSTEETPLLANDNWSGDATLKSAFSRLGAFALADDSKDAALMGTLAPSVYSVQLKGQGNGVAIAEVYDADASSNPAGRIINLSARTKVGTGDGKLVAGFVISGTAPKRLLIRAVGPTLGTYGVDGALADPVLELFAAGSAAPMMTNDNWGGTAELTAAYNATGAFSLENANSKDAAMVVTLNPGAYSAVISGKNDTTGVALVELYELP